MTWGKRGVNQNSDKWWERVQKSHFCGDVIFERPLRDDKHPLPQIVKKKKQTRIYTIFKIPFLFPLKIILTDTFYVVLRSIWLILILVLFLRSPSAFPDITLYFDSWDLRCVPFTLTIHLNVGSLRHLSTTAILKFLSSPSWIFAQCFQSALSSL